MRIAVENANVFIDYTVFIPLSQHRRVIAASHAHRSRNCKLTLSPVSVSWFTQKLILIHLSHGTTSQRETSDDEHVQYTDSST
jgi:hypothetical protein